MKFRPQQASNIISNTEKRLSSSNSSNNNNTNTIGLRGTTINATILKKPKSLVTRLPTQNFKAPTLSWNTQNKATNNLKKEQNAKTEHAGTNFKIQEVSEHFSNLHHLHFHLNFIQIG